MEGYYNRLYPGNNNLMFSENTRFNYLNELREQFTKFENEVWNYNSLRPDEAFKIDLKLPFVLIELFAKLFRLWRDFDAFQKLIKAELFHQVNDDMNQCFGVALNHFDLSCDTCDQPISVKKNDLKYSYELHSQDGHHQAVLDRLNYLMCPSQSDARVGHASVETFSAVETASDEDAMKDDFNGYIVITPNNRLQCTLCEKNLIDEQEAIHHVTNWPHRLKEMQFSPDDTNYVVDIDGTHCCRLCRCMLSGKKQSHVDHLSSDSHKMVEECHRVLKENEAQVTLLNSDSGEFMCESCDKSGPNWFALLEHYRSRGHRKCVSRMATTFSDAGSESKDFILFSDNRYECLLCQRVLLPSQIAEHQRDKEHVEKFYAILNNNESTNGPPLLDTSSESDGYNDAFKNNDIYIEISLGEDDCEVFKCVLCNKTGKGLDNLDAHCLTPIHQTHKSHIEKVSKAYAKCDVSDEPADAIMDIEDLYYCQVCDILIEDKESVQRHTKEKSHVLSEMLKKVLNENGDCVSILAEEPNRFYHCQLCSRSIDGDSNIVGHCTSGRHTQLLNMVKALSRNRSMRTI